jgi:hypothetical protein
LQEIKQRSKFSSADINAAGYRQYSREDLQRRGNPIPISRGRSKVGIAGLDDPQSVIAATVNGIRVVCVLSQWRSVRWKVQIQTRLADGANCLVETELATYP